MIVLTTRAQIARALDSPIDPPVRQLLSQRINLAEDARFFIAERDDRLAAIEAALGFILMDGALPGWDWVIDHGTCFEVAFATDDVMTDVLIIPDDGSKSALIAALRLDAIAPPQSRRNDKT